MGFFVDDLPFGLKVVEFVYKTGVRFKFSFF